MNFKKELAAKHEAEEKSKPQRFLDRIGLDAQMRERREEAREERRNEAGGERTEEEKPHGLPFQGSRRRIN